MIALGPILALVVFIGGCQWSADLEQSDGKALLKMLSGLFLGGLILVGSFKIVNFLG